MSSSSAVSSYAENKAWIRETLEASRDDPELFAAAILGTPAFDDEDPEGHPFWEMQRVASRMVIENHTCVFPWGNGLGKSWWLGRLCLAWLVTRPGSLVITTAPTFEQLDTVLWKNIRQAAETSKVPLGIRLRRKPLRGQMGEGWGILGISTQRVERMSGHHAYDLLVVVDEASDVPQEIKEAIDSLGATKFIAIGNPLRAEGWFRDLAIEAERQRNDPSIRAVERVAMLRVPSTASPHIHLDRSPYGMASGSWLRQRVREYGKNSLWYKTHIDALFPDISHEALIEAAWFDACTSPDRIAPPPGLGGHRRIAIDLSEGVGRDRSCVLVRDDLSILEVWHDNMGGLPESARWARTFQLKYAVEPHRITYDKLGIGRNFDADLEGAGVHNAVPYHGSASGGNDFTNLRSQAGWTLRVRFKPDHTFDPTPDRLTGAIPRDKPRQVQEPFYIPPGLGGFGSNTIDLLRTDLLAMRYELVGKKIKLENKEVLCKRLGRSDDLGGSLLQSFAFCD